MPRCSTTSSACSCSASSPPTLSAASNWLEFTLLIIEAVAYVVGIGLLGPRLTSRLTGLASRLSATAVFEVAVISMLGLSLLAEYIGLAAIVGAFLAGLVVAELKQHTAVEEKVEPLAWFFMPFFFVLIGSYLDLRAFADHDRAARDLRLQRRGDADQVLRGEAGRPPRGHGGSRARSGSA